MAWFELGNGSLQDACVLMPDLSGKDAWNYLG
jgi:hypothetical protein